MINRVLLFMLLVACHSSTTNKNENQQESSASKQSGTQKMIDRLAALNNEAYQKGAYYTLNSIRADQFAKQMSTAEDIQLKTQLYYLVADETLKAGKTKEAINYIEDLLQKTGNGNFKITNDNKQVYDLLAIAYLRLGEQDNCISNHTKSSCIIPIQPEAFHHIKTGSEKAIEIYLKILEKFPADLASQWLLNVAYMTLGEFPQKVPAKWRLPISPFTSSGKIPRFENIAGEIGLDVDGHAGGCCIEDFNGDGYLDLITSSMGLNDQIRLFINNGDGSFTEKTKEAGLIGIVGGLNMIHADYNNDGFPDILVLRGGWGGADGNFPNSLLKNNGNGTFEDVTFASGIYSEHPTQTAAWADFNLDGNLDLFIGNESTKDVFAPCEMYVNNGDGTFTEQAAELGLKLVAYVKGCSWGDVNKDGLPDLYVSTLEGVNKLYINKGITSSNNWRFEESAEQAHVQEPWYSFPTWFFDYDNDGWDDLFVSGYDLRRVGSGVAEDQAAELLGRGTKGEKMRLYHNNGNGTFTNVTKQAGLDKVVYAMGSNFGDINNDGYLDFYLATGKPDYRSIVPNRMFLNKNGKSFVDVTTDGGFGHIQKGHAVAFGDFDNDGDQDIYNVVGGAYEGDNFRNALYENPGNTNHWMVLKLTGKTANRSAIGAVVQLSIKEKGSMRKIFRTVSTGGSFGSSCLQLEIGLGQATIVDSLKITWPNHNHTVQVFTAVQVNQKYQLEEGSTTLKTIEYRPTPFQKKMIPMHMHNM